jgi:bifunctional ADP-heptose synthase (sugar kinase/adenylyltransferase)
VPRPTFEKKIDLDQLQLMLDRDMKKSQIARELHVHPSSITRAIDRMTGKKYVHPIVAFEKAKPYADRQFKFLDEIFDDIEDLNELRVMVMDYSRGRRKAVKAMQRITEMKSKEITGDSEGNKSGSVASPGKIKAEKKIEKFDFTIDPRALLVQIVKEKREHLALQYNVFMGIADAKNVRAFQKHLLDILGEMAPELREKFVNRLKAENAIRAELIVP